MTLYRDPIHLESQRGKQTFGYWVGIAVGGLMVWLTRDWQGPGFSNELAGHLLGWGIVLLCLGAMVVGEKRILTLDPKKQQLVLEIQSRLGNKRLSYGFDQIVEFYVDRMGSTDGGSPYFDIVLVPRTGKRIWLFGGTYFEGRFQEASINALCQRFNDLLSKP